MRYGDIDHDSTEPESTTYEIVERVADHLGTDPGDLPPLYGVVDPDALDGLFTGSEGATPTGHVSFDYAGCTVVVGADGAVSVDDRRRT